MDMSAQGILLRVVVPLPRVVRLLLDVLDEVRVVQAGQSVPAVLHRHFKTCTDPPPPSSSSCSTTQAGRAHRYRGTVSLSSRASRSAHDEREGGGDVLVGDRRAAALLPATLHHRPTHAARVAVLGAGHVACADAEIRGVDDVASATSTRTSAHRCIHMNTHTHKRTLTRARGGGKSESGEGAYRRSRRGCSAIELMSVRTSSGRPDGIHWQFTHSLLV